MSKSVVKITKSIKKTYEECYIEIDTQIKKHRSKWQLKAVCWMDFDDVAQIIRAHIYKKWHLYDQSRPLIPWVNTVISAQINNLLRNNYFNFSSPCVRCPANEGDGLCSIFGLQSSSCGLYDRWLQHKKSAFDIKLPLTIENHVQEVNDQPHDHLDIFKAKVELVDKLKDVLKPNEFTAFMHLYIEDKPEDELFKILGFKTTEKNRKPGYKQIKNIKKKIYVEAKKLIYEQGIDFS